VLDQVESDRATPVLDHNDYIVEVHVVKE
jgi:hypothetical protein